MGQGPNPDVRCDSNDATATQPALPSCFEGWLQGLHHRAIDRLPEVADRRRLLECRLEPTWAAGWPSFALATPAPGLPADTRSRYGDALTRVLADAVASTGLQPEDLDGAWVAALAELELPSDRMLLSQTARLAHLDDTRAVVSVKATWLGTVTTRRDALVAALGKALNREVEVDVVEAAE
jgi:hypothetical protein